MTNKLKEVYNQLKSIPTEKELRIMELEEDCAYLEQKLLDAAENLPYETKALIESYIYNRAELELHNITHAFQAGRRFGYQGREHYIK